MKILTGLILGVISCIPLLLIKFRYLRDSYVYEIFLRNYIFFIHYTLFITLILLIVNRYVKKIEKREFFLITALFLLIVGVMGRKNYFHPKFIRDEIVLKKDSPLESLKIAFISDLHLSLSADKKMFIEAFKKIAGENPDIVLIGGDFLDYSHSHVKEDYQEVMDILQPPHGIHMILGNHEYYGGIDGNIEYIKSLGINILQDEKLDIENVHIVGRDDKFNKNRAELGTLISELSLENPVIVLDHNPKSIDQSVQNGVDLHLSGHTHMGQFFPYNLVVKNMYKNPGGFMKFDVTNTIVSSGLGSWLIPYRIGTTSEINIITIRFNKNKLWFLMES